MKDRPIDPAEFPGTDEFWELQSDRRARINMQLDIEQEQIDYELFLSVSIQSLIS